MQNYKSIAFSEAAAGKVNVAVHKPELLCPAGSAAAFDAAIEGGADAIYIGGSAFNARINAKNFTPEEMRAAISRAHAYGVKVYIAANTLIYDREMDDYLRAAETAYTYGADALIIADLGAASLVKKYIPELEIHASTQLSGHNVAAARRLAEMGFSRMVCAREMSEGDIRRFTSESPIEAEVFVHGALCVCHSGQCLFSSLVGGRSGNRGECAQPCRLPYKTEGKNKYPLSLKDLCLAGHVRELSDMGVASFKIEGRMKSPEYVRDVARIWRRLIDENRNATRGEIDALARIFSRGGFTDGYYRRAIGPSMMGVRSDENKRDSRELVPFEGITRRMPIELYVSVKRGAPISLTVMPKGVTVFGDIPDDAITAPIDSQTVERCLRKLGGTPFEAAKVEVDIDGGLIVPISKLNALRRAAVDALLADGEERSAAAIPENKPMPIGAYRHGRSAVFYSPAAVTQKAKKFFDDIYLPLEAYDGSVNGVLLPAVIFDSEREQVRNMLSRAHARGATRALVGNLGHVDMVLEEGLIPDGDIRLNVSNNQSMRVCEELGLDRVILSPELTLPKMRDILGARSAVVYGRLPLMVTEKCVGREIADCSACRGGKVRLTDRKNISFPVFREWEHRSVIFNSVPFYMADKQDELNRARICHEHFIFSDETPDEVDRVIKSYEENFMSEELLGGKQTRRMN